MKKLFRQTKLKIVCLTSLVAFISACAPPDPLGSVATTVASTEGHAFPHPWKFKVFYEGSGPTLYVNCYDRFSGYRRSKPINSEKFVSDLKTIQKWMKQNKSAKISYNKPIGPFLFLAFEEGWSTASFGTEGVESCGLREKHIAELLREMKNIDKVRAKHLSTEIPFT